MKLNIPTKYLILIIFALTIKLGLFLFAEHNAPNTKIQLDSPLYLNSGINIFEKGSYSAVNRFGEFAPATLRTPGYPFFLGLFHKALNIPLTGIILIQIILNFVTAFFTYKTATLIDKRLGWLSAIILLFDPPITISTVMILTESLFLVWISAFMYFTVLYLKEHKLKNLIYSALMITCATYTRPISLYLGIAVAMYIVLTSFKTNPKKSIIHTLLFCTLIYSLLSFWYIRNYNVSGKLSFTTVSEITVDLEGLQGSYERNLDGDAKGLSKPAYYIKSISRCVISIMTYPGTLKYFKSKTLKTFGKAVAYPWMVFWIIGFIFGCIKGRKNAYFQFFLFIMLYFIAVTTVATLSSASGRFRVPLVPFISIISAFGWISIMSRGKNQAEIL